jgi:hypothetical protein
MAKAMGHSLAVHLQVYRRWIELDSYQQIYQRVLRNQAAE